MKRTVIWSAAGLLLACTGLASATTYSYSATLNGASAGTASAGTGVGSVVLDDVANTLTVNLSWTGLTTGTTAAHIHGPLPATGVLLPSGGSFPGFSGGPTSGAMAEQVINLTPAQVPTFKGYFDNSLTYFNIHTTTVPAGEIRGSISPVPEPASLALVAFGGLLAARRRARPA